MKDSNDKSRLIEQLKKIPIVQYACEKSDISRATYYRWRKEDDNFRKASDEALIDGALLVNDMAESQLISLIKDKKFTAIKHWLKYHHPTYNYRLRNLISETREELTQAQVELVKKAMKLIED